MSKAWIVGPLDKPAEGRADADTVAMSEHTRALLIAAGWTPPGAGPAACRLEEPCTWNWKQSPHEYVPIGGRDTCNWCGKERPSE